MFQAIAHPHHQLITVLSCHLHTMQCVILMMVGWLGMVGQDSGEPQKLRKLIALLSVPLIAHSHLGGR